MYAILFDIWNSQGFSTFWVERLFPSLESFLVAAGKSLAAAAIASREWATILSGADSRTSDCRVENKTFDSNLLDGDCMEFVCFPSHISQESSLLGR